MPARATVYQVMARAVVHQYAINALPSAVRETLYNFELGDSGEPSAALVPGHQLAFHCFNYGGLAALSFGAGLPWLSLYQAARMRGFRPKSRALLQAVLKARRI